MITLFLLVILVIADCMGLETLHNETQILKDMYDALQGEIWTWRSIEYLPSLNLTDPEIYRPQWNFSGYHDPCAELWQGVNCTCVESDCSITSIALDDYNLMGEIPSSVGNLTSLITLSLSDGFINGTLPSSIFQLPHLKLFSVSNNKIESTIPDNVGNCTSLEFLDLSINHFEKNIPESLYSLANLSYFDVSYNKITGEFSPLIGQLTNLLFWKSLQNSLTGTIPNDIANCSQLRHLSLENNLLHGSLPGSLNITSLIRLYIEHNQFTGSIPGWLNKHIDFDASYNQFTGSIPESVCDGGYTLLGLSIDYNHLTGTIPPCLSNRDLFVLILEANYFSGPIPDSFSSFINIDTIDIGSNFLTGSVPPLSGSAYLSVLYIQENFLTGNLEDFVNPTNQTGLVNLDVSNNEFYGTIPYSIYGLQNLKSMSLVSNCFTGSIPEALCDMKYLTNLDLDGIHTAKSCQHQILPFVPQSFIMNNHLTGTIPSCLFNLSYLTSIHISGNALDTTLPHDLVVSDSVNDITLSHNVLRGKIPLSLQTRRFNNLDLSYNCFSGVIYHDFNLSDSVSLEANRLSGNIPAVFRHAHGISILSGNLFGCSLERDSLPLNDPDYSKYQCGSDAFNQSYAVWGCLMFVLIAVLAAARVAVMYKEINAFKRIKDILIHYAYLYQEYMSVYVVNEQGGLADFAQYLKNLRKTMLRITILACFGLLPLYYMMSAFYSVATHEYSWNASALYLSGEPPAIILLCVFLGFLSFMIWSLRNFLLRWLHEDDSIEDATSNDKEDLSSKFNTKRVLVLSVVAMINCSVMLTLNGLYVYFVFEYSTFIVFVCQLTISLFKIFWNEYALTWMVRTGRESTKLNVVLPTSTNASKQSQGTLFHCEMDRQRDMKKTKLLQDQIRLEDAQDMPILTFIVIFNSIIAPAIANSVLSDQCYENVFIPPNSVNSQYSLCKQTHEVATTADEICFAPRIYMDAHYSPPFIYRYGCSSSFIRHYASVYVYMFILTGFGKPCGFLMWKYFYDNAKNKYWKKLMSWCLNKLLKEETIDSSRLESEEILFRKERFVLNNVAAICVLLTVGVVFPPIAAVVLFAIYSHTYMNQLIVGRFVAYFEGEKRAKVIANLSRDCEGIVDLFKHSLLFMIPFTSIFYACYLLDIYGDAVGWRKAIWASVVVFMMPIIVFFVYQVYRIVLAIRHQIEETEHIHEEILKTRAATKVAMGRASYYNKSRATSAVEMKSKLDLEANDIVSNPMSE